MSEQHLRQQSRRTNTLYGIMGWMYTSSSHINTHIHTHGHFALVLFSLLLLPVSSAARQQKAAYWTELWGGNIFHHFKMKQVSFFSFLSVVAFLSFFFGLHPHSSPLCSSLFCPFFHLPHIYIIFPLSTLSLFFFFFPLPVSVCKPGNSLCILLWANEMTRCFLITSALSYSSTIILLVSTT